MGQVSIPLREGRQATHQLPPKPCGACRQPFVPGFRGHKLCDRPACRRERGNKARAARLKPCRYPGCDKLASGGTTQYCSESHRVNAYKASQAATRRNTKLTKAERLAVPVWPTMCQCGSRTYMTTNGEGGTVCACPRCRVVIPKEFPLILEES